MDVGLSILPCLTSPLRISSLSDPQHKLPAAELTLLPRTVLFSIPKLSHYHLHGFDIINSYPTLMITV